MERMAKILHLTRLDELAGYILEGRPDPDMTHHTAKDLADAAYRELENVLKGVEQDTRLDILEAAEHYSDVMENAAFAYGMRACALLLQSLFSREELLF